MLKGRIMDHNPKGPSMGALWWMAAKLRLGWAKSEEPAPPRRPFWAFLDELSDGAGFALFLTLMASALAFAGGWLVWAGPWIGAAGQQLACAALSCEPGEVRVARADAFTPSQLQALRGLGVEFPSALDESRAEGNLGVGLALREQAAFAASVSSARQAWAKDRNDREEILINSAFSKAVLLGQSVEEAKRAASAVLRKREREGAEQAALFDAADRWLSSAPTARADWALARQAMEPRLYHFGVDAKAMDPKAWALRQTHWWESLFFGVVWTIAGVGAIAGGARAWRWGAKRARDWVEEDRERLTREWEKSQLAKAASRPARALAPPKRL